MKSTWRPRCQCWKKETSLKARLLSVMRLKISTLEPYHEFAGALFKTAADPHSPLNPFAQRFRADAT